MKTRKTKKMSKPVLVPNEEDEQTVLEETVDFGNGKKREEGTGDSTIGLGILGVCRFWKWGKKEGTALTAALREK
ncbi:hypothetical protein GOBAR_DD23777 [Gossypium barbadense]|nr:hypothetical protein GOBAR_DD23777 [Gossypium barbadense]